MAFADLFHAAASGDVEVLTRHFATPRTARELKSTALRVRGAPDSALDGLYMIHPQGPDTPLMLPDPSVRACVRWHQQEGLHIITAVRAIFAHALPALLALHTNQLTMPQQGVAPRRRRQ